MSDSCVDCAQPAVSDQRCWDCLEEVGESPEWDAAVPRKFQYRRCGHCAKLFQSQAKKAGCCSRSCATLARWARPKPPKTCPQCGVEWQPRSDARNARYCSPLCARRAAYGRARATGTYDQQLAARRATRIPARHAPTCAVCSTTFEATRRDARYCSKPCANAGNPNRCTRPDCGRPRRARGLCGTHYNDAHYTPERRHAYATPGPCEHCGKDFHATRKGQRFCSLLCRSGGEIQEWTDAQRRAFREARRKRRALMRQVEHEDFGELEIYERDRWRCGICLSAVSQTLRWPHPMSPSLDHIVPVTEHGGHTRANVRLAHLVCNTRRGNRGGGEQLALIG